MIKDLVAHWETFPQDFDYFNREDREVVVNMILADKCQSVVEFALGTGITPQLLRKKGFKGWYVGTDIIENFLNIARQHNPNEDIRFADLEEPLPFKDKEFEAVVVFTGLGYSQDLEKVFKEFKRIAKYIYISQFNLFASENNLRFLRGEGWGNQYSKEWFDEMLKRVGLIKEFEAELINGKDYLAMEGIATAKKNYILKLCVQPE